MRGRHRERPESSGNDNVELFDSQGVNDPELSEFLKFLVEGDEDGLARPPRARALSRRISPRCGRR